MRRGAREATRSPGERAAGLLAALYLAAAGAFGLVASGLALRDHFRFATQDDWRILDLMAANPLPDWLFTQQNGHYAWITLLLVYLDYEILLGQNRLLVAASVACGWATVAALWVGMRTDGPLSDPLDRVALAFSAIALFWAGSFHDFLWGVNQMTWLGVLWLALALGCAARSAAGRRTRLVVAAGVAGFLASFSHGMGFATWAALLVVALAGRFPWRVVASLAGGALLTLGVYVSVGRQPIGLPGGGSLLSVFQFALAFAGATAQRAVDALGATALGEPLQRARILGSFAWVGWAGYAVWVFRHPARAGGRGLLALGLVTFTLAGGALVAMNRLFLPAKQAIELRFLTWTTLAWIGFACALPPLFAAGGRAGRGAALGLLLVSVAMLPAFITGREQSANRRDAVEASGLVHLLGIRHPALFGDSILDPSPERVYRVADRMRRDGRNIFADPRVLLPGAPLVASFAASAEPCAGAMERPRPLWRLAEGSAARVEGWVACSPRPAFVAIADADGVVRGLGSLRARGGPQAEDGRCRWFGFIADHTTRQRYAAFAIDADAEVACPLGW